MLAAIGEAFGAKGSIKKLGKALHGSSRAGDSSEIAELRRRFGPMVKQGLLNVKEKT